MTEEEMRSLALQSIGDFDYELHDRPGESLPEVDSDHTVVEGVFWLKSVPGIRVTQICYRLATEGAVNNADGIEAVSFP